MTQPHPPGTLRSRADDLVLSLRAVTRRFGGLTALHPVDIEMSSGAMLVVEGPNGAGKSTLLRVAAGLLRPSRGTRRCSGGALYLRPGTGGRAVERVVDSVRFVARADAAGNGLPPGAIDDRVDDALQTAGLATFAHRRVGTLSSGEQSRLSLALLRAGRPAVACLDEPTAHLDKAGVQLVAETLRTAARSGTALVVAVHDSDMLTTAADVVVRLEHGRVCRQSTRAAHGWRPDESRGGP